MISILGFVVILIIGFMVGLAVIVIVGFMVGFAVILIVGFMVDLSVLGLWAGFSIGSTGFKTRVFHTLC